MKNIAWIVDDDKSIRWVLERALNRAGLEALQFDDGESVLRELEHGRPDVVISDIRMPGISGIELLEAIAKRAPGLPVVIMTAFGDLDSAVDAFKYGAFEYLTKPFDIDEAVGLVQRAIENSDRADAGQSVAGEIAAREMLGDSPAIQEIFRIIGRLSGSVMSVLVRGESGTGKELVAQALYQNSPRSDKPMVAINTAAIPAELLESELFGHEKGAFTGAHARHIGRFEQADQGTLFLDEIGDMPAALQTRLLRVLSEGRFFRVGGREEVQVDVRVIAATNQNLEKLVEQGRFRDDLFHRLNVITITLPTLAERIEDIPLLVKNLLRQSARELGVDEKFFGKGVAEALKGYSWPGNVRELENLIRRLTILAPSNRIEASDLPAAIFSAEPKADHNTWQNRLAQEATRQLTLGEQGIVQKMGEDFERVLIEVALKFTGGHKKKAAQLLGWGRNTLTRKLK